MGIAQVSVFAESFLESDNQKNASYEVFAEVVNIPSQIKKNYLIFNGQVHAIKNSSSDGSWMSYTIDLREARDSLYTFISEIENNGWDSSPLLTASGNAFNGGLSVYPRKGRSLPNTQLLTTVLKSNQNADLELQRWPEKKVTPIHPAISAGHQSSGAEQALVQAIGLVLTIGLIVFFLWFFLHDRRPPCPNPPPTATADGRIQRNAGCRE